MKLGIKIKQLREARKKSQKELAEEIGIETTYLSKIENGKVKPYLSENTIEKIARNLVLNSEEYRDLYKLANKIPNWLKQKVLEEWKD